MAKEGISVTNLMAAQMIVPVDDFTRPDGCIRALFATVAFVMAHDSPNMRFIGAHLQISNCMQEKGCGGYDKNKAIAVLYYHNIDLSSKV